MKEKDPLVKVSVRLPRSLTERMKIRVVKERTSLQELVETALEAFLKTPLRTPLRKREGEGQ
jgi:hypothetical protein